MLQQTSYSEQLTFFQKLRSLDFWLIFCTLILGCIGTIAMYSSESGELLYYTNSHIIRFVVFFSMMIFLSFVRIRFWHSMGYFFLFYNYFIINLYIFVWNNCIRITAMDKFIFS